MIRAVIQNGLIRPLEPLPAQWTEGRHVIVEDADLDPGEELDHWYRELQLLGPAEYEPGEWQQVQAIMEQADERAKVLVRREMGLN